MNWGNQCVAQCFAIAILCAASAASAQQSTIKPSYSDLLAAAKPSDWRAVDAENTLYLELPTGRVVIELAPAFAPRHAENIKALVREKYFDGLFVIRSHDNYVAQWGDPDEKNPRAVKHRQDQTCAGVQREIQGREGLATLHPPAGCGWLCTASRAIKRLSLRARSEDERGLAYPLLRDGRRGARQ